MKAVFYNTFDTISLPQDSSCQFLDIVSEKGKKTITIQDNTSLSYLLFVDSASFDLDINVLGSGVNLHIYVVSYSAKHIPITVRVHTHIQGKHVVLEKYFLSFLGKDGKVTIDSDIHIDPSAFAVQGQLSQEYIVLGNSPSISTIPGLSVCSKDVSVNHACKIHTFDETSLFYLGSKGLSSLASKQLLLDGYFSQLSSHFDTSFSDYFDSIKYKILRFIFA